MNRAGADDGRPDEEGTEITVVQRRTFLTRGGLLAGGAALGVAAASVAPAGAQVSAQAIDYIYVPIPPQRLYDSRSASGPLFNGQTRVLQSDLNTLNPPPIAVTFNLTVTLTRQKGWLAMYPGNTSFNGTSSINWFGDFQDLANNAFVEVPNEGQPTDGQFKVTCGGIPGAQADFVLDLIGASAGFTVAAASASDVRSQLQEYARSAGQMSEG